MLNMLKLDMYSNNVLKSHLYQFIITINKHFI